jgi:hypothetical protein
MKASQWAAWILLGIGLLLILLAFTTGERMVVGNLPSGHLKIRRLTVFPLLWSGLGVTASSLVAYLWSLRGGSGTALPEAAGAAEAAPDSAAEQPEGSGDAEKS